MRITRKQTLRSLSLSYPQKDWPAGALPRFLWVRHRLQNIIYEVGRVIFYSQCHTHSPARQSFFGYDNDKDLKVCFLVMRIIYRLLCIFVQCNI